MLLTTARVTNYKSIEDTDEVQIDESTTVLVGQNESGKTAFLRALYQARPVEDDAEFDYIEEYPRRWLVDYERRHATEPDIVAHLTYQLEDEDLNRINDFAGFRFVQELSFTLIHKYNNAVTVSLSLPEKQYVQHRVESAQLSTEVRRKAIQANTVKALINALDELDLNEEERTFLEDLKKAFPPANWESPFEHRVYTGFLRPYIPTFLYFDDYYLLPGKVNLRDLKNRIDNNNLRNEDKTARSLLRLAGIDLSALTEPTRYESVRAKLEAISISITDKIFKFWTQNTELSVEFDIRSDTTDEPPYDEGDNLYIRIRNPRHRVTVPFSQRSKGFIWFFSFITWFDSIQHEVGANSPLILLLDEPGLSLHALAQADFLRYIDDLSADHQVLYTTHSPFMVNSGRLHQVRTVEDRNPGGTKVSSNISNSEPSTIFPLQAALGYNIAQNLFLSERNLLVEGPADLVYLQFFSNALIAANRVGLREEVVIVPVGGLDKLATFVALLGANKLKLVVLHDHSGKPDQRLENLIREKIILSKQVLNYGMFRNGIPGDRTSNNFPSTDIEDLMSPGMYLTLFNNAYKDKLGGVTIKVGDLGSGDRIVDRINNYLQSNNMRVRPNGGFNHYLVANFLASNSIPKTKLDKATLDRFETLFMTANELF